MLKLFLRRSSTKDAKPTVTKPAAAGELAQGELWLNNNHDSPALFARADNDTLIEFKTSPPDATTAVKGVVQLADAAAITAGTAGRVVDAAQLKSAVGDATEAAKGVVELATAAETTAGTDGTRAVHPAGLKVELDKKVKLSGDTMTGNLTVPSVISSGTSHFLLPVGTTVQRPTSAPGQIRYNSTILGYEAYDAESSSWIAFVGGGGVPGSSVKAWLYAVSNPYGSPFVIHQYNIGSLTQVSTGRYKANFKVPLPAEYAASGNCQLNFGGAPSFSETLSPLSATSAYFEFATGYVGWSGSSSSQNPRNQGVVSLLIVG